MLADTLTCSLGSTTDCSIRRSSFSANAAQSSTRVTSGIRMTNSSPPSRTDVVGAAYVFADAQRDAAQQFVAGGVTQRVVDQLEAVEVDEEQGEPRVVALRTIDLFEQGFVELVAIAQPGQVIVIGEVG